MSREMMRAAAVLMLHHQTMVVARPAPRAPQPWYRAWWHWLRDRYNLVGYQGAL